VPHTVYKKKKLNGYCKKENYKEWNLGEENLYIKVVSDSSRHNERIWILKFDPIGLLLWFFMSILSLWSCVVCMYCSALATKAGYKRKTCLREKFKEDL